MAKIIVYNNNNNTMETYHRGENEAIPYNVGKSLTVKEFRGTSRSSTLWTDRTTIETWNQFRAYFGSPINVGYAFKRPWEGGHGQQSQHYAGTAFDTAQGWSASERENLRRKAISFGKWSYVEPASIAPTWVHFDKRFGTPACSEGGYPTLSYGSRGNYVLVLQDSLNALGFINGAPDGIFGAKTRTAASEFQRRNSLQIDGIVGCNTWRVLMQKVVGIGRTAHVID